MANKKTYWLNKKGNFGSGKSRIVYGDEITVEKVGDKDRFEKFIKAGDIGEKVVIIKSDNSNVDKVKNELAEFKKVAAKQLEAVKKEYEEKIKTLTDELAEFKKAK